MVRANIKVKAWAGDSQPHHPSPPSSQATTAKLKARARDNIKGVKAKATT